MITQKLKLAFIACTSTFLTLFTGCNTINIDDLGDAEYNPSLAVPIGNFEASMFDIVDFVDQDYLKADSATNIVYYIWKDDSHKIKFDMCDLSYDSKITTTESLKDYQPFSSLLSAGKNTIPAGDHDFTTSSSYPFKYNKNNDKQIIEVDSAKIGSAQFNCDIKIDGTTLSNDNWLEIIFVFPNIKNSQNNQFSIRMTSNEGSIKENMSDFTVYFNDDNNSTKLQLLYTIHSNGTLKFNNDLKITYTTELNIIDVKEFYGFVWQKDPVVNDEIKAEIPSDFFNQDLFASNNLLFSNPEFYLNINSYLGVPIRLNIDEVYSISENGNKHYADFNGNKSCSIDVKRADNPGDVAETTVKFDKDNGQTYQLFEEFPKEIHYLWKIYNDHTDKNPRQFAINPLDVNMNFEVRLPLQFNPTSSLSFNDTIDADFTGMSEDGTLPEQLKIDFINVHLDVQNGLPITINGKLEFLDENNVVVYESDSISIPSASVNEEGIAQLHSESNILLPFKGNDIDMLFKTKKIKLSAKATGYNDKAKIDIRANNRLKIHISAFAKVKATLDLDSLINK